jgi:hypothetical protein
MLVSVAQAVKVRLFRGLNIFVGEHLFVSGGAPQVNAKEPIGQGAVTVVTKRLIGAKKGLISPAIRLN